jgi:predicted GNAT family acetyltransferase
MTDTIIDNTQKSRYELAVDDRIVYANYRKSADTLYIDYVEAPVELRGTGAAGRLMEGVMKTAQAEHMKVIPICGYAASWIKRHPEYQTNS